MGELKEDEKTFRERLGNDIKSVKKMLMLEELNSFFCAAGFAANAACAALLPVGFITLLNVLAAFWCIKRFKPTVKKQIVLAKHLEFLSGIKKDKVWTQGDK